MDEWQVADERNNRERISRAREAAEELFRPAHHAAQAHAPGPASNGGAPAEQEPRRSPRIFAIPPRRLAASPPQPQPVVAARPRRRPAAAKRSSATVPPSQFGRVRALGTYGMTPLQVAELYGVTVSEIERILRTPAYSVKSR